MLSFQFSAEVCTTSSTLVSRLYCARIRDLLCITSMLTYSCRPVHVCNTGFACLTKIRELESIATDCTPTMVFLDITIDPQSNTEQAQPSKVHRRATSSASAAISDSPQYGDSPVSDDFYGIVLLKHIGLEISNSNLSKLTVPIAVVHEARNRPAARTPTESRFRSTEALSQRIPPESTTFANLVDPARMIKFLEAGAIDVVQSPFSRERLEGLAVHGYRGYVEGLKEQPAFLELKRMRKRSWVGVDEEKPYAYLRESMYALNLSITHISL